MDHNARTTDAVEAQSLSFNPQHIDIYNVAWGPNDDGRTVGGPRSLTCNAILNGIAYVFRILFYFFISYDINLELAAFSGTLDRSADRNARTDMLSGYQFILVQAYFNERNQSHRRNDEFIDGVSNFVTS